MRVVARLTPPGSEEMARWIGPGIVEVEGVVQAIREDGWEIGLLRVQQAGRESVFWNREPVLFPREVLASVQERRLDRNRSVLAAGGITGGALLLARLVGGVVLSGGTGGGGGGPVQ